MDSQKRSLNRPEDNKGKNSRYFRYAKIGAAAVGAGAVLALTGGLAAPAVAAAFVVMGGTTAAAAAVSVTTMAAVFGSAGAGLTGYKMLRRTRGLQEFEFEQHDRKGNQLAVMVMISGWIENREDYKRVFGVVPDAMSLTERLTRYYLLYCPERLHAVEEEAALFAAWPEELFAKLRSMYGKDPQNAEDLQPAYPEPSFSDLVQQLINLSIDPQSATGRNQDNVEIHALNARHVRQQYKPIESDRVAGEHVESVGISLVEGEMQGDLCSAARESSCSGFDAQDLKGEKSETEQDAELEIEILGPRQFWSWRELDICPLYELHLLRWELSLQQDLGSSIVDMLKSLSSTAIQNVLAYTVFAAMATAVMWPVALLKLTDMIDGLWTIAVERADQAGRELAKALLARPAGSRPVTLVGYSLGARVIFSCLKHLARSLCDEDLLANGLSLPEAQECKDGDDDDDDDDEKDEISDDEGGSLFESQQAISAVSEPAAAVDKPTIRSRLYFFKKRDVGTDSGNESKASDETAPSRSCVLGIVQDVVLLGAPISLTSRHWKDARRVVAGRLVNGYSERDKVLSIVYRYQRFKVSVSGIAPVTVTPGVENVDLSALVDQHVDYCRKMKEILTLLDLTNCSDAPVTVEEDDFFNV